MPLRPDVRVASFRGVEFTCTSADTDGLARRAQTHEFPFRQIGFTEDLGAQTPSFSFDCFVAWEKRDELVAACRDPGPGTLVHPLFGTRSVICTKAEARESTAHVGHTFFSLTFVEAGDNRFPDAAPNTGRAVEQAVDEARPTLQATMVERFLAHVPQWVTDSSIVRVLDLQATLERTRGLIPDTLGRLGVGDPGKILGEFNAALDELSDAAGLVADPPALASQISLTIQKLAALSSDPGASLRMLESFLDDFASTWPSFDAAVLSSTSFYEEGQRQDAMVRMVRSSALVETALSVKDLDLESYNESERLLAHMVELFDPEIDAAGDVGDDAALNALLAVRHEMIADLTARSAALARVRSITLAAATPAIVLSYRLYVDPERGEEIVRRNQLRHPMFLPAAHPLEVLSA